MNNRPKGTLLKRIAKSAFLAAVIGGASSAATARAQEAASAVRTETGARAPARIAREAFPQARFPTVAADFDVRISQNQPSLPSQFIDAELRRARSPAAGFGSAFVRWGNHYSIKPEIGLAFFMMESSFGTRGLAKRTLGIGNIRYSKPTKNSPIKYGKYKGFRKYASWEAGVADFFKLLASRNYAGGQNRTLQTIISRYSPPSENATQNYVNSVAQYLNRLYSSAAAQQ